IDARADLRVERLLDGRDADEGALAFRPAAAEQVRPAVPAERLRAATRRREAPKQLLATDDADRRGRHAEVDRPGSARELLAARGVARAEACGRGVDLESHAAAKAGSVKFRDGLEATIGGRGH